MNLYSKFHHSWTIGKSSNPVGMVWGKFREKNAKVTNPKMNLCIKDKFVKLINMCITDHVTQSRSLVQLTLKF